MAAQCKCISLHISCLWWWQVNAFPQVAKKICSFIFKFFWCESPNFMEAQHWIAGWPFNLGTHSVYNSGSLNMEDVVNKKVHILCKPLYFCLLCLWVLKSSWYLIPKTNRLVFPDASWVCVSSLSFNSVLSWILGAGSNPACLQSSVWRCFVAWFEAGLFENQRVLKLPQSLRLRGLSGEQPFGETTDDASFLILS